MVIQTGTSRAGKLFLVVLSLLIGSGIQAASYCLEFGDSCDAFVTVHYSQDFDFHGPFTVECWFTVAGHLKGDHVALVSTFGADQKSGIGWQIGLFQPESEALPTKAIGAYFDDFPALYAPFDPVKNHWYHLALTYNGSMVRLFLDGEMIQELDAVIRPHQSNEALTLGGQCAAFRNRNLNGRLDEVRISSICRYTEDFIPKDFHDLNNNTVALWHFDEGRGDTVYDEGPHGHHGIIHRAQWIKLSGDELRPFQHIQSSLLAQRNFLLVGILITLALAGIWFVVFRKRLHASASATENQNHLKQTSSWVFLAQRMTHQIKTPLSTILMSLERIQQIYQKKLPPEDCQKADAYVEGATTEIKRLIDSSRAFMQFLKIEAPAFELTDLSSFLDQFLQKYKMRISPEVSLETDFQLDLHVNLDTTLMNMVLENLLDNALKAIDGKGIIRLSAYGSEEVSPSDQQINGKAFIEIEDTGRGMSAELVAKVFQPYTSNQAEGTGLGLFIVRRIVEDHQARIRIISREGLGTKVILELNRMAQGKCLG
jgi:signal transduction histidine kinase